ncbi:MAG: FAD-binding oxidoreductase, partial [Rhodoplanes sp.]
MNTLFRPPLAPDLIARFAAIVGAKHAITDAAEQESYLVEERGLYHGRSAVVLRPGSFGEVSAILTLANEIGAPIVPQGGNTGLVGGQIPLEGEIVLSLRRLDRIREVDPASNTMTCEAGVLLARAQDAAAGAGRLFPLSLGAEGSCTIGGNLATNAGGIAALAYGVARDLALGLEVALADGRVWHGLNKLKKDNTGYDLKNLFIGAEGTLGVITAAVLKLFPAPKTIETAFVGLASLPAALDLLALTQEATGGAATSFELIGRRPLEFAIAHGTGLRDPLGRAFPWYVLVELKSSARENLRDALEDVLASAIERGVARDATIAESIEQRNAFWRLREFIPEAQKFEGGSIKHDVSVPIAAAPDF